MTSFLRFDGAIRHQPQIDSWFESQRPELAAIARHWFSQQRNYGPHVTELLHGGPPAASVDDAAFGYVNGFTEIGNIGFSHGASQDDPWRVVQETGRLMRQ